MVRPAAPSRAMAFRAAFRSAGRPGARQWSNSWHSYGHSEIAEPQYRVNIWTRESAHAQRRNTGAPANVCTLESAHARRRIGPCLCARKFCAHDHGRVLQMMDGCDGMIAAEWIFGWVRWYDFSRVNALAWVPWQCAELHSMESRECWIVDVLVENLRGLWEVYIPRKCKRIQVQNRRNTHWKYQN